MAKPYKTKTGAKKKRKIFGCFFFFRRLSFKINGIEEKNDTNNDDYMKQTADDSSI